MVQVFPMNGNSEELVVLGLLLLGLDWLRGNGLRLGYGRFCFRVLVWSLNGGWIGFDCWSGLSHVSAGFCDWCDQCVADVLFGDDDLCVDDDVA